MTITSFFAKQQPGTEHISSPPIPFSLACCPALLEVKGGPVLLQPCCIGAGLSPGHQWQQWMGRFHFPSCSPWVFPTSMGASTEKGNLPAHHHCCRLGQPGWNKIGAPLTPRTTWTTGMPTVAGRGKGNGRGGDRERDVPLSTWGKWNVYLLQEVTIPYLSPQLLLPGHDLPALQGGRE